MTGDSACVPAIGDIRLQAMDKSRIAVQVLSHCKPGGQEMVGRLP